MVAGRLRLGLAMCAAMLAAFALSSMPVSAASAPAAKANWNNAGKPHVMPRLDRAGAGAAARATVRPALTNGTGNLFYGGLAVQDHPRIYLDFWGAGWNSSVDGGGFTGAQGEAYVQAFVSGIPGSPSSAIQTQFCQGVAVGATTCGGGGAHVGTPTFDPAHVFVDTASPPPATNLTFNQIAAESDAAASHFGLFRDNNATIIVLTPTGQSTFQIGNQAFCGFHDTSNAAVFAYIPWSPDLGASCGTNAVNGTNDTFGHGHFDGLSIVTGHEVAEAATDPFVEVDPNNPNIITAWGWLDQNGLENADKCEFVTPWPATNVAFGANHFAVQPLWSNATASCPTEDLGGGTNGGAAIASWDNATHRDAFVRGLDNGLWWNRWNGSGWSGWSSLGGLITSDPAAVSWGTGRTDVFAIGRDGAMWHNAWTGSAWSGWSSLGGGFLLNKPAASSWQANGLDVAAVGQDHAMWHIRWNGSSWSSWQSLGGGFTSGPTAVSWRDGTDRVDIFARGQDGAFWQDAWAGGSWTGWLARGGGFRGGPAATSTAAFRLQLFGVGLDGALWHETWNGSSWSGFSSLEAAPAADPAAVSPPGSGSVELAVVNANRSTEHFVTGSS